MYNVKIKVIGMYENCYFYDILKFLVVLQGIFRTDALINNMMLYQYYL